MAKDVITRFKLETTAFDSKIKQAAKELSAYSKTATQAKEGFNQFTKANVDAARALGTMGTNTTNVKDRVKELVGAYNDAAKAYESLTKEQQQSDWAKALAGSLTQLQQRIKDAKNEMQGLGDGMKGGGGLFSGIGSKMEGALAVFGGNLMTKAAGAIASLGSEMYYTVRQGIELARQGEGIRIAFERLGRGDILDGLRQATHGTVTDLELMKAAVKFNDFKLPVEELGTMLAFAQQKAKDTGQSVDYMVDSIVTGLGRKSLMILDNLGLSATEIKDRMKDTGDMTKAVGQIIREQMAKAGDYAETAADRAAQANVSLQNKMEELGRKFAPVEEASNQLWTSMKIGILDIIGGPLARLLNGLTEAGRLKNMLNDLNGEPGSGNTKVDQQLKKLNAIKKGGGSDNYFNTTLSGMVEDYNRQIMALDAQIKNGGKKPGAGSGESKSIRYLQKQMNALQIMRDQMKAGAKEIVNATNTANAAVAGGTTGGGVKSGGNNTIDYAPDSIAAQEALVTELTKKWKNASEAMRGGYLKDLMEAEETLKRMKEAEDKQRWLAERPKMLSKDFRPDMTYKGGFSSVDPTYKSVRAMEKDGTLDFQKDMDNMKFKGTLELQLDKNAMNAVNEQILAQMAKDGKAVEESWKRAGSAIGTVSGAISQIEDPAAKIVGTIGQAIATIALAYAERLAGDKASKQNIYAFIATAAAATISLASTIASIHSSTGYAEGGIVKGNHYSGDMIGASVDGAGLVGLNAQEVVLNRAQSGVLAAQLQSAGSSINMRGVIKGEDLLVIADRSGQRQGLGQLMFWK